MMNRQYRVGIMVGLAVAVLIISAVSTASISRAETEQIPLQSHDFTDVPVAGKEFMESFINAFYHQGVTTGCNPSPLMYCPENTVTRGEVAVFIGRALGYAQAETDNILTKAYFKNTASGSTQHGIVATSVQGQGVTGISSTGPGVAGSGRFGVYGVGTGNGSSGVYGITTGESGFGVYGGGGTSTGVYGTSGSGNGVVGGSGHGPGVYGTSIYDVGVMGSSENDIGIMAFGYGDFATDSIYDLFLGGDLGEMYGSTLHLFSDGNITFDLDHNGTNANNSTFSIRDHADNIILTLTEDSTLTVTNLQVSGTKANIVDTVHYGTRTLYAVEATESWFEDFGSAQLVDGMTVIEIDPIFAETVNLSDDYHVYLTPIGDPALLYIDAQTPTSFTVRSADRNAEIRFHYRIVAKRLGYEDVRLEEVSD